MQKHIAVWELLAPRHAQFALTFCIQCRLSPGHPAISCYQGTDSSVADATTAKGITSTPGMAHVDSQYFLFLRRGHVFANLFHTPGHANVLADAN